MRFVLADENLTVAGRCYAGFPLLLDDDGDAIQPAQTFLWSILTSPGRVNSKKTWNVYGRALYDFFAFVLTNKLDWKLRPAPGLPSAIAAYRDWSKGTLLLSAGTVNQRLRLIVKFYEWTLKNEYINELPFEYAIVQTRVTSSLLAHIRSMGGGISCADVMLRETTRSLKFLTIEQIQQCIDRLLNITHSFMFRLMVRTGLRQVECRTFPHKYLFDPKRRADLSPGQKIRVVLSPHDMKLKNDNARDIDMPYDLMEDLYWYASRHRQARENNQRAGIKYSALFLTESGEPYGDTALTGIFSLLKKRVGFDVRPHILRHTYATYLLWSLRKSAHFAGEPLLYVRDRMGHRDVTTTAIYLHLINSLEGHLALAHEDEIDRLFLQRRPL